MEKLLCNISEEQQLALINENPLNITKIANSILTDNTICYALSKKGSILELIPNDRKTKDICEFAIFCYPSALKNVPDDIKTFNMCLDAVIKDQRIINNVPIKYINAQFIEKLNASGVLDNLLKSKHRNYINECLKINQLLEKENNSLIVDLNKNKENLNIKLNNFPELLSSNILNILNNLKIYTVYDLLYNSIDSKFYEKFINNTSIYKEIRGAIKLLKCKFLEYDPMISFDKNMDLIDALNEFGFSLKTSNRIVRSYFKTQDLYELLDCDLRKYKIKEIVIIGDVTANEILFKTQILFDYYQKINDKKMIKK